MRDVIALVLGGGRGTRLFPLTGYRSKPAVPLGTKYRLIDIPLSNCINSGINRAYVLTQFMSVSLHRHVRQTYRFDQFNGQFGLKAIFDARATLYVNNVTVFEPPLSLAARITEVPAGTVTSRPSMVSVTLSVASTSGVPKSFCRSPRSSTC